METASQSATEGLGCRINIRAAAKADLDGVAAIDQRVTGNSKPDYWRDLYERYDTRRTDERFFLIAEPADDASDKPVVGYILGEVRAWEFGSEPCGWVFAFSVDPDNRLQGVGELLFEAISARFRVVGIKTMRTMVGRENRLHMAFFRSEGMTAGPYIQLEMELD
ncbi:MAG: GNAT family N-acetyltransferase [Hyphomicrobiales bacterium]|nr:GNAT family N-acetyltransferase [Hyphomicrobiales bacterium]MCP4999338.1 GNAT family N-acetyltransferase [Hyphomicrobiales bacterium]